MRDSSTAKALPRAARTGTAPGSPEDLRANARNSPVMRPMRSASWAMRSRLICTVARSPRSRNRRLLPDKVRSAVRGWFSSWATPVESCPITASLPACTSSFCAALRVASARMRSCTSCCRRSLVCCKSDVRCCTLRSSSSCAACRASRAARRSRTRSRWWRRRWLSMKPSSAKNAAPVLAIRA